MKKLKKQSMNLSSFESFRIENSKVIVGGDGGGSTSAGTNGMGDGTGGTGTGDGSDGGIIDPPVKPTGGGR